MPRVIIPTDVSWKKGKLRNVVENSSNVLQLASQNSRYAPKGRVECPVVDINSDARLVDITRPGSDPGSIDSDPNLSGVQILQRASGSAPVYRSLSDDFNGYGLNTDNWAVGSQSGSCTYTVADGKLNMTCPATDSSEMYIRSTYQPDVSSGWAFETHIRINDLAIAGTKYVGIGYRADADFGFVQSASEIFIGIKIDGGKAYYYGVSGNTTVVATETSVPSEIRFRIQTQNGQAQFYRTGAGWIQHSGWSLAQIPSSSYVWLVVHNETASSEGIDIDVLSFEEVCMSGTQPLGNSTSRPTWSDGQAPFEGEGTWGAASLKEDYAPYTNNLSIKPSSADTWQNIGEGKEDDGTREFATQWRTQATDVGVGSEDWEWIIDSTTGFMKIRWNDSQFIDDQFRFGMKPGYGLPRPIHTGGMMFTFRNHRDTRNITLSDDSLFFGVDFFDEDDNYISRWRTHSSTNVAQVHQQFYQPDGWLQTISNRFFDVDVDVTHIWNLCFFWDTTQDSMFLMGLWDNNGIQYSYPTADWAERHAWMRNLADESSSVYVTNGARMLNASPVYRVEFWFNYHTSSTDEVTMWLHNLLFFEGKTMPNLQTSTGVNYWAEGVNPLTPATEGTNQASYYETGRYNQVVFDMEGA